MKTREYIETTLSELDHAYTFEENSESLSELVGGHIFPGGSHAARWWEGKISFWKSVGDAVDDGITIAKSIFD